MASVSRQTETNWQRIVRLFNAWESATPENNFSVLSIASGRGAKIKLEPFANEVKELLETHNRNVKPILEILQTNHGIKVSKMTLLNFLKASGL